MFSWQATSCGHANNNSLRSQGSCSTAKPKCVNHSQLWPPYFPSLDQIVVGGKTYFNHQGSRWQKVGRSLMAGLVILSLAPPVPCMVTLPSSVCVHWWGAHCKALWIKTLYKRSSFCSPTNKQCLHNISWTTLLVLQDVNVNTRNWLMQLILQSEPLKA